MNHYFQTLELHKVLERLAEETSNSCTRQMALEIEPSADPARVQQLLGMTEDALQLSIQWWMWRKPPPSPACCMTGCPAIMLPPGMPAFSPLCLHAAWCCGRWGMG